MLLVSRIELQLNKAIVAQRAGDRARSKALSEAVLEAGARPPDALQPVGVIAEVADLGGASARALLETANLV